MSDLVPVLTIDGPSGSGKGATSSLIAQKLQWHLLDSGSIYRSLAWLLREQHDYQNYFNDEVALAQFIETHHTELAFQDSLIFYQQRDITSLIRTDEVSLLTSAIAQSNSIRQCVLSLQRNFAQSPGLVADGRDMGSVVFPDASYKIFLTADIEMRAKRRYQQLISKGEKVSYQTVLDALQQRDEQDQNRSVAPLIVPNGAIVIDNSQQPLEQVVQHILKIIITK